MRIARERWGAVLALGGVVLLSGCTTLRSRLYEPDESGVRAPLKLRGMPVTVEVPTHLQVTLTETHYYAEGRDGKLTPLPLRPSGELKYDVIKTKELYTTDFKRPPSGKIDLKLEMSTEREGEDGKGPKKRYFKKVNQDTVDTTITDVAALVQAVINKSPLLFTAKGTAKADDGKGATSPGTRTVTVTVASEVFDLRQPNLEGRIQAFYDEHLNKCAERCGVVGVLGAGCPAPAIAPVVTTGQ